MLTVEETDVSIYMLLREGGSRTGKGTVIQDNCI
jgi:hypothetical protein